MASLMRRECVHAEQSCQIFTGHLGKMRVLASNEVTACWLTVPCILSSFVDDVQTRHISARDLMGMVVALELAEKYII
eukprot:1597773-Amphidinium_carterae.2